MHSSQAMQRSLSCETSMVARSTLSALVGHTGMQDVHEMHLSSCHVMSCASGWISTPIPARYLSPSSRDFFLPVISTTSFARLLRRHNAAQYVHLEIVILYQVIDNRLINQR